MLHVLLEDFHFRIPRPPTWFKDVVLTIVNEIVYNVLKVSEVINHPKAGRTSKGTWDYDFTILSLSDPLPSYAIPICLPPRNYDFRTCSSK